MVPSPSPPPDIRARIPYGERVENPLRPKRESRQPRPVHRDAVQHGVARERIEEVAVGEDVAVDAGASGGDRQVGAVHAVTPTVGDADDARHDGVGHLDRDRDLAAAGADGCGAAVRDAKPVGVVRMEMQGATLLALHEHVEVVHPRVVRAEITPSDEHHLAVVPPRQRAAAGGQRRRRSVPGRARSCRSRCATPRGCAAARRRGRCRVAPARAPTSDKPDGSAPKPSP